MTPKQPRRTAIRSPNQKSIPRTFFFQSRSKINGGRSIYSSKSVDNRSPISLSAFLDSKLNSTSVDMKKTIPDSSEAEKAYDFGDGNCRFGVAREGPAPAIEESVFKLFNRAQVEKVERTSSEVFTGAIGLESGMKKHSRNHLAVLGDDPRPKRRANSGTSSSKKKPRPVYNHYENGTGWWDSEREGVDNDEVGVNEVWEGVGTTTLGALDQHL